MDDANFYNGGGHRSYPGKTNEFAGMGSLPYPMKRICANFVLYGKDRRERLLTIAWNCVDAQNIIRQYNWLVEQNYRKHHQVKFYAEQLNRSPKTLSNFFALYNCKKPVVGHPGKDNSENPTIFPAPSIP
ncbi:MAG TPA: hypothetical protein VHW43_01190 [Puia sp.]|nr:hypothetical protein [Puia sp.]